MKGHLGYYKSQDIQDKFYPAIITVDFIEKESGVFLGYKDENCASAQYDCGLEEKLIIVGMMLELELLLNPFFFAAYYYLQNDNNGNLYVD